jgi:hypothetical protein
MIVEVGISIYKNVFGRVSWTRRLGWTYPLLREIYKMLRCQRRDRVTGKGLTKLLDASRRFVYQEGREDECCIGAIVTRRAVGRAKGTVMDVTADSTLLLDKDKM